MQPVPNGSLDAAGCGSRQPLAAPVCQYRGTYADVCNACSQCLTAVSTLLDAVRDSHSPHLFASIEESLLPLLRQCLQPDPSGEYCYREFIEDVLEIMTRLSYYGTNFTVFLLVQKCKY
jgi:hypothetical protein